MTAKVSPDTQDALTQHVSMIHERAKAYTGNGKLIVASFAEYPHPETGEKVVLPAKIFHPLIGDVGGTVEEVRQLTAETYRNAYMALAVFKPTIKPNSKGSQADILAVLGLVADFDDANAHKWAERAPLAPNYVLETSTGRYQCFYVFDQPLSPAEAKPLAVALTKATGCDKCASDFSHVWRVPGCLNWPTVKKLMKDGRSPEPQRVTVVQAWDGTLTSPKALAEACAQHMPEPDLMTPAEPAKPKPAEPNVSVELILSRLPNGLLERIKQPAQEGKRSDAMNFVVKALTQRSHDAAIIERILLAHPEGAGAKYIARGDLRTEIDRIRSKVTAKAAEPRPEPREDGRPVIQIDPGRLPEIVTEAESALIDSGVGLFQRGNTLVLPVAGKGKGPDNPKGIDAGVFEVTAHRVLDLMSTAARWQKYDARREGWAETHCPMLVAEVFMSRVGAWNLPTLTGIINAPTLRPDGSILETPGYDKATGLLFDPRGVTFRPLVQEPTRDQALAALGVLKGLISTFPFVSEADRSVALSAILTPMVRRSLPTAPLHAFNATVAGSGKSLLVDIASMIAMGQRLGVSTQGKTEEENEKRIGSSLLNAEPIITIDNCDQPIGGNLLCQVITQPFVRVRILGKSESKELLANSMFFATGNNLQIVDDMTRRTLLCTIDPGCERPETREFDSNPLELIRADRELYVRACLTVLRAYRVAGSPKQTAPLGSMEEWSRWVRDALVWLGEPDPCITMDAVRKSDPKLEATSNVFAQWQAVIGTGKVAVRDIIEVATKQKKGSATGIISAGGFTNADFREALLVVSGEMGNINSRKLGKWLAAIKGRVVNGMRIVPDGGRAGTLSWRLEAVDRQS